MRQQKQRIIEENGCFKCYLTLFLGNPCFLAEQEEVILNKSSERFILLPSKVLIPKPALLKVPAPLFSST